MAASHPQWQPEQNALVLTGALDRDTVPALWAIARQWQPSQASLECSLQAVTRIDSAGMVMLIHLIEHAKKAKLSYNVQFRAGTVAHIASAQQC
jgi:phospholipid transport system transporter-binding protein